MKKTILIFAAILAMPAALFAEKVPYLGIATKEVSPELKAQLDIKHGVVVADVANGGPAEGSLQKHDIVTKLGDQKLMNPAQLSELIQTFKKDETVVVEFVRAGKNETAEVTLGEHELAETKEDMFTNLLGGISMGKPIVTVIPADGKIDLPKGLPEDIQKKMKVMIENARKNSGSNVKSDISVIVNGQEMNIGEADKMAINLNDILKEVGVNINGKNGVSVTSSSASSGTSEAVATTVWNDNGVTYQITSSNGDKVVKITEGGKTIFEGPVNSDEEMDEIPEEHRKKLEEIQGKVKIFNGKKDHKKKKKAE
ncbi:PDZ domain-containing protein [Verrucomicrobiales bacterium]|nr:PDZ domain-containing protein [Verrucomicrobiales bacterium]